MTWLSAITLALKRRGRESYIVLRESATVGNALSYAL